MKNIRFFTERLNIADMQFSDCDYAAKEWGNEISGKYMCDPFYKNGEELRDILKDELENSEKWTDNFYFSVFKKENDEIIGTACAFEVEKSKRIWGIGYSIKLTEWNRGYGTELVNGLCEFLKLYNVEIINTLIAKENISSLKICFKNGFEIFKETEFIKSGTDIKYSAYELRKKL